ncbi:MAG TPA: MauE/DoxX family redox-associated membrane protein [Ignavibacteriales bacterium]|nr:MauE/DoxX family redox-associated membrane protein [Ignavibacteriales bacterium]
MDKQKFRIINIALQITLGLLFLLSAILKATDLQQFISDVQSFNVLSLGIVEKAAIIIVILEFLIGFAITASIWPKLAIAAAVACLVCFEVIAFYSVLAHKEWVCSCFGPLFRGRFSYSTIIRDTFMLALAIYIFFFRAEEYLFKNFPSVISNTVITLFIVLFAAALIFSHPLNVPKENIIVGCKLTNLKFQTIDGEKLDLTKHEKKYLLLVFFDAKHDCASCLTEFLLWKKLQENYNSAIQVVGIGSAPSRDYLALWVKARKIKFPVVFDYGKTFIGKFNITTPIKIFLDQNNAVVLMNESTGDKELQGGFTDEINAILDVKN